MFGHRGQLGGIHVTDLRQIGVTCIGKERPQMIQMKIFQPIGDGRDLSDIRLIGIIDEDRAIEHDRTKVMEAQTRRSRLPMFDHRDQLSRMLKKILQLLNEIVKLRPLQMLILPTVQHQLIQRFGTILRQGREEREGADLSGVNALCHRSPSVVGGDTHS